ncbi:hypothetical protein HY490_04275 [Candidatus Woesearchaeota archaeon]|nr:hypothetical protein [Candidatus Woesearchaeota archaeon]
MKTLACEKDLLPYLPSHREDGFPIEFTFSNVAHVPFIYAGPLSKLGSFNYPVLALASGSLAIPCDRVVYFGNHQVLPCKNYCMHDILQEGIQEMCDAVMSAVRAYPDVLGVISLSVLDASACPSSPHGGMSMRELLYCIRRLRMVKSITNWAVVDAENNPKLAAKIVSELL